jgi:phytoene dehydrogenase-like protein
MADKSYDAVVIGSGHNALVVACYLQDAGLSTVVLEKYHEVGGGASGLEAPLPGFVGNDCAGDTRLNQTPVYQDLELYNYGYKGIFPDPATGTIFDDETCVVVYPAFVMADEKASRLERSEKNIEKTMKEISRFSEKDAETYYKLVNCWEKKWREAYWEWRYNPPFPWGVPDPLERLVEDKECPIDARWLCMTGEDMARELFDSQELQLHFLAYGKSWGVSPLTVMSFAQVCWLLMYAFDMVPVEIVKGGTHTIAHALQRRFSYSGGEFIVECEVDKVLVEDGKARGVRLVDGTEIEARQLVISNQALCDALLRFIGEEYFSSDLVRKIKKCYEPMLTTYMEALWGHFALHELPNYKAANFNPDCMRLARTQVAPNDMVWWRKHVGGLITGTPMIPPLTWFHHQDSVFDPLRAPDGKVEMLIEQFAIFPPEPTERGYKQMKKEYPEMLLKEWVKLAPNMTSENLIGSHFYSGIDIAKKGVGIRGWVGPVPGPSQLGRNLPLPELSQYRMLPIKNYYATSCFAHEGVGVVASPGYNCYKIIAEDLGLKKPWEEKGRPY